MIKNTVVVVALVVGVFYSLGASALISTQIEPIVGYERAQKIRPTPHTTDRLVYGGRLRVGVPLISAEAEYTRAQDREEFPTSSLSILDTTQRAKVGAVSMLRLNGLMWFVLRAGGQATHTRREETQSGVTTVVEDPIRYNPYAGAGLRVRLGKNFMLDGDLVTVFRDFPNMNNNEYMTSLGFSVSFP